jgi:hypothetical protein
VVVRTPGRDRTAGLDARNVALSPLSYEGLRVVSCHTLLVRAEGFEPPQQCNWVTASPDSPASARSHEYPRRDLNP